MRNIGEEAVRGKGATLLPRAGWRGVCILPALRLGGVDRATAKFLAPSPHQRRRSRTRPPDCAGRDCLAGTRSRAGGARAQRQWRPKEAFSRSFLYASSPKQKRKGRQRAPLRPPFRFLSRFAPCSGLVTLRQTFVRRRHCWATRLFALATALEAIATASAAIAEWSAAVDVLVVRSAYMNLKSQCWRFGRASPTAQ
jgi:hypothetical protein